MAQDIQHIVNSVVELWNTGNAEIAKKIYTDDCQRIDPNLSADTRGGAGVAVTWRRSVPLIRILSWK